MASTVKVAVNVTAKAGGAMSVMDKMKVKLRELYKDTGRGSTAGMLQRALKGGAVALIGSELKNVTGAMAEASDQFRMGTITAGGMADKMAEAIPIFGSFYTSGKNITEMFTGEKAAAEKFAMAIAAQEATTKTAIAVHIAYLKAMGDTTGAARLRHWMPPTKGEKRLRPMPKRN